MEPVPPVWLLLAGLPTAGAALILGLVWTRAAARALRAEGSRGGSLCPACLCFRGAWGACPRCGWDALPPIPGRVRVIGTLSERDRDRFVAGVPEAEWVTAGTVAWTEWGPERLCVLPVNLLPDRVAPLPREHVIHGVAALWLAGPHLDSRTLGQALDRFIRLAGLGRPRRDRLPVLAGAESLAPEVRATLEARFATIRRGVSPLEVARRLAAALPEEADPPGARAHRVLAALRGTDYQVLAEVEDTSGRPLLCERGLASVDSRLRTRVLHPDRLPAPEPCGAPSYLLRELEAVWTERADGDPLALGLAADRLLRLAGPGPFRRRKLVLCVGQTHVEPEARRVLEARFGEVRTGVPAARFLREGAAARSDPAPG